ncbi:MAG TPA: hypothetical protein P5287_08315, partial [bacterium]|nr:hypothetical protein [bacterium]
MQSVKCAYNFFMLTALIAVIGGYLTIAQIVFIREFLVIFYGNELSIGVILALWLSGITAGAIAGGRILNSPGRVLPLFFCACITLSLLLVPEIFAVRIVRSFLSVPPGMLIPFHSFLLSAICIIVPFSCCGGFFLTS